jgi:hypothetical protein
VGGATSGKALAVASALVIAAVWSSSCSTPAHRGATAAQAPAARAASQQQITPGRPAKACFGPTPRDWTAALARVRSVTAPAGVRVDVATVAGDTAYGQYMSAAGLGIGSLDLLTGRMTRITGYGPDTAGVGSMAADPPWLVWEQLDSRSIPSDWSIHALNTITGTRLLLATSRLPDGSYARGQQPLPVTRAGQAAWAQPVRDPAGGFSARLRVVDIATGRTRTLDSGRVSSPVYAGPYLIWGKVDDRGAFQFRAVNADTLALVPLPPPLAHPGTIGFLAGSPRYLAWSTRDATAVTVWPVGSPQTRTLTSHDGRHFFQFMQLAGHFMIWFGTATYSVLDLNTGHAFDVPQMATVTGSPTQIVISQLAGAHQAGTLTLGTSRVSSITTTSAPGIVSCG